MKTFLILLLANFCVYTNVFPQGFNSVFSKDGNIVWAAGNNGSLFNSNDGGSNWSSYTLGSVTLNSVFAMGQKVWIAANNGALHLSTNNGMGWTTFTVSSQNLNSVFFIDENNGWLVGNSGTILRTTNGGFNWSPQSSPVAVDLKSVKLTDLSNGIACGVGGRVIYWNGSQWSSLTTPTIKDLQDIDMKSATIIATAVDGLIIKSTNSGSSWSIIDYKIVTKSNVNSIYMVDANTFYSCGGGGFIRKSTDGGTTFSYQQNPMMANLVKIYFYDLSKGWAVSSKNNGILRTSDGGNTWLLPTNTTVSYSWTLKQAGTNNIGNGFCLHPTNKNTIFIAMGNQVYRSLDIGETWTQIATISPGSRAHTFFVNQIDTNIFLASMDVSGGRVVRSTNYGLTWSVVWGPGALTSYGMPMQADQNSPNLVYLTPDNAQMLKSTNFGLNWSVVGPQIFRSPDDIEVVFENPNIIYISDGVTGVGNADFFKTTNTGANWTVIHSVSGSEIPMISISSLDLMIAYHTCWSSGGFWKTANQWNSYQQIMTTPNAWATDIAKDDPTAVAFGVYASPVYISTNSGVTFVTTTTGSSPEAGMLFYDKGTLLSQKGGGVFKLSVIYNVPTVNSIRKISSQIPENFNISQNFPNPFNAVTVIIYEVPSLGHIKIPVYDALGNEVQILVDMEHSLGTYEVTWDASDMASGIYFYTMYADGQLIVSKRMVLVK